MIINHFKMRSDIDSYHLGGMGCSAGVIAIGLAQKLLRVGADRAAGFGVVERATHWVGRLEAYLGVGLLPTQVPGLLASTSCCRAFAGLCRYQRAAGPRLVLPIAPHLHFCRSGAGAATRWW